MSRADDGKVLHYVRTLAIVALAVINIVLIALNLQKHEIYPFEVQSEAQSSLQG